MSWEQLRNLQKNRHVLAYINPANPLESVLHVTRDGSEFCVFLLGCGVFLIAVPFGIFVFLDALRPDKSQGNSLRTRIWLFCAYIGLSLIVTSFTGLFTAVTGIPPGWWQWCISAIGILVAVWKYRIFLRRKKWNRPETDSSTMPS